MKRVLLLLLSAVFLLTAAQACFAQIDKRWKIHDMNRPLPPVVDPGTASMLDAPGRPPSDAVVLFDGKDLSKWEHKGGSPAKWKVENGYAEVVPDTGNIFSKQGFGDCQLHVEFAEPLPAKGESQERGNSGVSVWYSFWGEASSRQEYYDICGLKDERFANLVRLLIERLIADSGQAHLDADGVALGLIGVLEILWQNFAFQTEVAIDRAAARHRAMSYLRSIFPTHFAQGAPMVAQARDTASAVFETGLREVIGAGAQFAGLEAQIPAAGDFLTVETATERILLLRDAAAAVRCWRIARRP